MAIYDEHDRAIMVLVRLDPPGGNTTGNSVALLIPELELELFDASVPAYQKVTEPPGKPDMWWLIRACQSAVNGAATLFLNCDTVDEAVSVGGLALLLLAPHGYQQVDVDQRPKGATLH